MSDSILAPVVTHRYTCLIVSADDCQLGANLHDKQTSFSAALDHGCSLIIQVSQTVIQVDSSQHA